MANVFEDIAEIFRPGTAKTASGVGGEGRKSTTFTGFGEGELSSFMQQSSQLGSAQGRVDTSKEGFGPQKRSFKVANNADGSQPQDQSPLADVSEDQVKGFVAAFTKRQDEVFGRRAQPGLSQSRLV